MYDTLLPLFSGAQSNVAPNEVNIQPMQVSNDNTNQPISDADLHDALVDKREDIEESRTLPKGWYYRLCVIANWMRICLVVLVQARIVLLISASYVSDCYALVVSSFCDESELVTFDEAHNSKNWMAAMQSEYDAIMQNGTRTYVT